MINCYQVIFRTDEDTVAYSDAATAEKSAALLYETNLADSYLLALYAFKDPYNFSFIGTMALQHERDIENRLAERMTEFMLGLGYGFACVGRQYNVVVDGDDCYIGILKYHLKLLCDVVVKLEAVEFIPEFVSKLNFYISAVD